MSDFNRIDRPVFGALMDGLSVIGKIQGNMERWVGYNSCQNFFRLAAIRNGIDTSHREIEHCVRKLRASLHFILSAFCY